jgi:hypothetical protein
MTAYYNIEDRLLDKCSPEPNTGCWLWFGASQPSGYGQLWNGVRPEQAHRVSFRLYRGEIPSGCEIDHKCRKRSCVNPEHLAAITHQKNILAGDTAMAANAKKTHCHQGHELAGRNLRIVRGTRQCRLCEQLRARTRRHL